MQQMPMPPMDPSMLGGGMPPPAAPAGPASFNPADLVAPPAAPKKKKSGGAKPKSKGKGKY